MVAVPETARVAATVVAMAMALALAEVASGGRGERHHHLDGGNGAPAYHGFGRNATR